MFAKCQGARETTMTTIDDAFVAQLQDLMQHHHRVIAGEPVEGYLAEVPELPGCITAGRTPEEALSNLEAAMAGLARVGAGPRRPDS